MCTLHRQAASKALTAIFVARCWWRPPPSVTSFTNPGKTPGNFPMLAQNSSVHNKLSTRAAAFCRAQGAPFSRCQTIHTRFWGSTTMCRVFALHCAKRANMPKTSSQTSQPSCISWLAVKRDMSNRVPPTSSMHVLYASFSLASNRKLLAAEFTPSPPRAISLKRLKTRSGSTAAALCFCTFPDSRLGELKALAGKLPEPFSLTQVLIKRRTMTLGIRMWFSRWHIVAGHVRWPSSNHFVMVRLS